MSTQPVGTMEEASDRVAMGLQVMADEHYAPSVVKEALHAMVSDEPSPGELALVTAAMFVVIGWNARRQLGVEGLSLTPAAILLPDGGMRAIDGDTDLAALEEGERAAIMAARGITAGAHADGAYVSAIVRGAIEAGPKEVAALNIQTIVLCHELDHEVQERTGHRLVFRP